MMAPFGKQETTSMRWQNRIKQDLITVMQWATKWRMNVNLEKTEICAFSRSDNVIQEARQIEMKINDTNIQYNTTPKILGVTLDEN